MTRQPLMPSLVFGPAAVAVGVAAFALLTAPDVLAGQAAAINATARVAFVPFWFSYCAGGFAALGVRAFEPIRRRSRDLGLGFAAAIGVHLAIVGWRALEGVKPSLQVTVIFGVAAFLTLILTAFSIPSLAHRAPRAALAWFRTLATTYIALAFLKDFLHRGGPVPHYGTAYLPFAVLLIVALAVRAAAFLRTWIGPVVRGVRSLKWSPTVNRRLPGQSTKS